VHFLHNWSWEEASVPTSGDLRDLLSDQLLGTGQALRLGAWDVRVLEER
jgi:beta-galactosidase